MKGEVEFENKGKSERNPAEWITRSKDVVFERYFYRLNIIDDYCEWNSVKNNDDRLFGERIIRYRYSKYAVRINW